MEASVGASEELLPKSALEGVATDAQLDGARWTSSFSKQQKNCKRPGTRFYSCLYSAINMLGPSFQDEGCGRKDRC